jgi:hypothetical protein
MKETLEEAAENYGWRIKTNTFSDPVKANDLANSAKQDFINGAKWQAKRSYSDDEVRELIIKALTHNDHNLCGSLVTAQGEIRTANFGVWFEENKKKIRWK